ncbi:MAG: hypothetical protein WAQ53_11410 [Thiofilum sp.]|uniref:hypothetical protein n=1 Tax=Thiofilum sp. TaxID=2212733 RepID=UPI0025F429CC|nr:hypothetical protein [Thiofilum sp.]MBK8452639.1 hypothetical protein [Thiofilum sp.]
MKAIMVSALLACGLILSACSEPSAVPADKGQTGVAPVTTIGACTEELQRCPDGTAVGRNPANNCAFDTCPSGKAVEEMVCTMEVKMCPDGTAVGRDGKNNCEFKPCK